MPALRPLPVTSPATMRRLPSLSLGRSWEEVAADLACRAVVALDYETGKHHARQWQDDLLDLLRLLYVEGKLPLLLCGENPNGGSEARTRRLRLRILPICRGPITMPKGINTTPRRRDGNMPDNQSRQMSMSTGVRSQSAVTRLRKREYLDPAQEKQVDRCNRLRDGGKVGADAKGRNGTRLRDPAEAAACTTSSNAMVHGSQRGRSSCHHDRKEHETGKASPSAGQIRK